MKKMTNRYQPMEMFFESSDTLVYRACEEEGKPSVIIKAINQEIPSSEAVERFRREYELLDSLAGKGAVSVYGLEFDGERPLLLMEDIGGYSLGYFLVDLLSK